MLTAREIRQRVNARRGITPASKHIYSFDDLSIVNKENKLVPFKLNRAQADYQKNRTGRDLLLKARQEGFSSFIEGDCTIEACNQMTRIAILAHDDITTQKLRRMTKAFWSSIPQLIRPRRTLDNATTVAYADTGSEVTIATAGNVEIGRGGTYTRVHGSEVAFWKDAASIMAGIMQGVPAHGRIELESTPNGAQGWFYEKCIAALGGDPTWKLHFYAWWWADEYRLPLLPGERIVYTDDEQKIVDAHGLDAEQIKWRRAKVNELGAAFFQEYPEDIATCFLTGGNSVFGDVTRALYMPPENDKPIDGHYYVAGLDWGQSNNYTALSIRDCDDDREVYLERWRRESWASMRTKVLDACEKWHVNVLAPENNSASSNVEDLVKDAQARDMQIDIVPFTMTNERKSSMVAMMHKAIHEGESKFINMPIATAELHSYQSMQTKTGVWTYDCPETDDGSHGDTVIARMAALRAQNRRIS